ncbi:GNAT family N-acetyltransferase [Cypionkella sp.]|uniref:GNAT family N-acetyltransferase n=1 Tax=Cypionkella sp. TaxID=2811411 RepID=UPI002FDCB92B
MIVRAYQPEDADALAQIFYDAVRIGAAPYYATAQLQAWAPQRPSAAVWTARLTGLICFVACDPQPVGFMALRADGYLDLAFVAPAQQRRGVASLLHQAVLTHAQGLGLRLLTTESSLAAQGFFAGKGWQTLARQSVQRHGQAIENFRMQREI